MASSILIASAEVRIVAFVVVFVVAVAIRLAIRFLSRQTSDVGQEESNR